MREQNQTVVLFGEIKKLIFEMKLSTFTEKYCLHFFIMGRNKPPLV